MLHAVVPEGFDDPLRPSGGNVFDRRVLDGLLAGGWAVDVRVATGETLGDVVSSIPDGALVLIDGLLASPAAGLLAPAAGRLRLVVLVHMPLGTASEGAVLHAATAIVTTSAWSRQALLERHGLPAGRVRVAEPGVDAAELADGTPGAGALLAVGAVIPGKGYDVLLDALSALGRDDWRCLCVGSVERDPAYAGELRRRARERGLDGRLSFAGVQPQAELRHAYAAADLLVHPSRAETYGMVIAEALAHGVPVVATDVGGVGEALGHGGAGRRPGLLVPGGDAGALRAALADWLADATLRGRLRQAARERRATLRGWPAAAAAVAGALTEAAR
jgi:glycosyltransferase involved in cell wall biosynthesis